MFIVALASVLAGGSPSAGGATTGAKWHEAGIGGTATALSCTSASYCIVGLINTGTADISTFNGTRWTSDTQVFQYQGEVEALGCFGPGHCVAISGTGETRVLADGKWSKATVVDHQPGYPFPGVPYAMSCSSNLCELVDGLGHVLTFDGRSWSAPKTIDLLSPITTISCVGPGWCEAADGTGHVLGLRNGRWSTPESIDSAGISEVSCATSTRCIVVDLMGRTVSYYGHGWTVITDIRKSHTAADFIAFLNKVNAQVPKELDVHVILDNLATHKTPKVHEWLLRHRRFHFHFTPTYGSWMNLVERWFSALTTKKLQRSAHRSVKALTADIEAWVATWNDDPKPFVWHKTADEILERLAGYCSAINLGA